MEQEAGQGSVYNNTTPPLKSLIVVFEPVLLAVLRPRLRQPRPPASVPHTTGHSRPPLVAPGTRYSYACARGAAAADPRQPALRHDDLLAPFASPPPSPPHGRLQRSFLRGSHRDSANLAVEVCAGRRRAQPSPLAIQRRSPQLTHPPSSHCPLAAPWRCHRAADGGCAHGVGGNDGVQFWRWVAMAPVSRRER
ncbi:hypothetical protein C8R44DRAFT_974544 [Mycena epipterygia]|nr:hypothetical protein C8R44DRAFT_974544 [Mycena epipterygia]